MYYIRKITYYCLLQKNVCEDEYNENCKNITWEKCSIRNWLNEKFYTSVFNNDEKMKILTTVLPFKDNQKHRTNGGNNTNDKVFLLSIDEANKYFNNDDVRATGGYFWLCGQAIIRMLLQVSAMLALSMSLVNLLTLVLMAFVPLCGLSINKECGVKKTKPNLESFNLQ